MNKRNCALLIPHTSGPQISGTQLSRLPGCPGSSLTNFLQLLSIEQSRKTQT